MNVVVFGASGMIGTGVVLECLHDPRIGSVLTVGRSSCGIADPKLREIIHADLFDLAAVADELTGLEACFYCLGVSAAGMSEADYRRVTLDLTVAVVEVLERASPGIQVCFVSGRGTDGTGASRMMWARVKGEAENWLLERPLEAYVFRPGIVQPLKGARSKTALYRTLYTLLGPGLSLARRAFPASVTTTVQIGQAMINAVTRGYPKRILEPADIEALALP